MNSSHGTHLTPGHPLSPDVISALLKSREAGLPNEVCGVLTVEDLFRGAMLCVREVTNGSKNPSLYFEMDATEVMEITSQYEVIGVWHSHPASSPQPSELDLTHAYPEYRHFLVVEGKVLEFTTEGVIAEWAL